MQNMSAKASPRLSDRRIELSFKLLEKGTTPDPNISHENQKHVSESIISLDIHNALTLIMQLEDAITIIFDDVKSKLTVVRSTPELSQEDPTHRKKV